MTNIEERLAKCFAIALPDLPRSEIPRAVQSAVPKWDSLAMVNLLALIEEEFAIQISDDDLARMTSFELILGYLQSKAAGAAT
jgi:acyl carrier protein